MTGPREPCPSLVRFLALRRVQRCQVTLHEQGLFTDHGRKIPSYIETGLRALLADGHLELHNYPSGHWRSVRITQSGLLLYTELHTQHTQTDHGQRAIYLDRVLAGLERL